MRVVLHVFDLSKPSRLFCFSSLGDKVETNQTTITQNEKKGPPRAGEHADVLLLLLFQRCVDASAEVLARSRYVAVPFLDYPCG